jgi:hypothetical protein
MIHESVSRYRDHDLVRNEYDLAIALVQSGHDFLYELEYEPSPSMSYQCRLSSLTDRGEF